MYGGCLLCPLYPLLGLEMDVMKTNSSIAGSTYWLISETRKKKINRPSPHYAPVSKHKEMRTRLGWTISYKSLYFVHPSLEWVPLFTGMRERSIRFPEMKYG